MLPTWVEEGVTVYQVHALGAAAGRGLRVVEAWVDHVADLGCRAMLLTPIHESSTHGYDTIDASRLDPRLGTESDFDALVARCQGRGVRLLLDGVFNHVGRAFPTTEWLSGGVWEGHDELPTLDHANAAVLDWATAVARHWLDRGAGGWRFDVAYAIPRPFLRELVTRIRATHPEAFLFGEIIHGDYVGLVSSTGLHSATQYELFKAIWSALNDANLWELAWALDRHRAFTQAYPPVTFLGNHDVTRIATNLQNPDHLELALAVLFTVPGIPCVYYGDEFGWQGTKEDRAGGDDAIRPPLPAAPPEHPLVARYRHWVGFRSARPWLTTAPLEVVSKTNRVLEYRAGALLVRLDLDAGVRVDET